MTRDCDCATCSPTVEAAAARPGAEPQGRRWLKSPVGSEDHDFAIAPTAEGEATKAFCRSCGGVIEL